MQSGATHDRRSSEGAVRGARGVLQLQDDVRHGAPLPRRNRAAAKAHLRGERSSLQRHAHWRLRAPRRCARASAKRRRFGRSAARLLARRYESADGLDRHLSWTAVGDGAFRQRDRGLRPRRALGEHETNHHESTQKLSEDCERRGARRGGGQQGGAASVPEAAVQSSPRTQPPLLPSSGRPYNPVVTLNGWTLPWRMNNGVKEFHLVAEPVVREMAPGMKANLWGYNGQSAGPDHRGRRRRPGAHLRHQSPARAHHHSLARACCCRTAWTGWAGWSSRRSPPGKTFVYEFDLTKSRDLHVPPAR